MRKGIWIFTSILLITLVNIYLDINQTTLYISIKKIGNYPGRIDTNVVQQEGIQFQEWYKKQQQQQQQQQPSNGKMMSQVDDFIIVPQSTQKTNTKDTKYDVVKSDNDNGTKNTVAESIPKNISSINETPRNEEAKSDDATTTGTITKENTKEIKKQIAETASEYSDNIVSKSKFTTIATQRTVYKKENYNVANTEEVKKKSNITRSFLESSKEAGNISFKFASSVSLTKPVNNEYIKFATLKGNSNKETVGKEIYLDQSKAKPTVVGILLTTNISKVLPVKLTTRNEKSVKFTAATKMLVTQSHSINQTETIMFNQSNSTEKTNHTTYPVIPPAIKNTTVPNFPVPTVPKTASTKSPLRSLQNCFQNNINDVTNGEWVMKDTVTEKHIQERYEEDRQIREAMDWPQDLYRSDRKCGKDVKLPDYRLFSQCDPAGINPCCDQEKRFCGNGPNYCKCQNCTDFKSMISAELYRWEPKKCKLKEIEWKNSCRFLHKKNISLHFMGDSLVRHIHTVLLLHLTNDYKKGAIPQNTTKQVRKECEGVTQLTKKSCSMESIAQSVSELPPNFVCKGLGVNLNIEMSQDYYIALHPTIGDKIDALMNRPDTWIIGGVGLHYQLNFPRLKKQYLDKVWQKLNSSTNRWPKIIWFENHGVSGFLREVSGPNNKKIENFNRIINRYLTERGIQVIPTFDMSDNVRSYDGRHYGIGFNEIKVQLLVNYLKNYYNETS